MKNKGLWIVIALLVFLLVAGVIGFAFYVVNRPCCTATETTFVPTQAQVCPNVLTAEPECPDVIPPTQAPTPEPTLTLRLEPYDVNITGCPIGSLGVHPNTGEPLIFKDHPYPGVLCEFEVYYAWQIAKVSFPGYYALVQDWTVSCPIGPECEGTWVQFDVSYIPANTLVHYWVYANSDQAATRWPTFACEYVAQPGKGHTNANIRVPEFWSLASGSTYSHPGCPLTP